jgi:hypothetical protein
MVHLSHLVDYPEKKDICIFQKKLPEVSFILQIVKIHVVVKLDLGVAIILVAFVKNVANKLLLLNFNQIGGGALIERNFVCLE